MSTSAKSVRRMRVGPAILPRALNGGPFHDNPPPYFQSRQTPHLAKMPSIPIDGAVSAINRTTSERYYDQWLI